VLRTGAGVTLFFLVTMLCVVTPRRQDTERPRAHPPGGRTPSVREPIPKQ